MHRYRSHTCAQLRKSNVGETARLSGWVHRVRDDGGLLFALAVVVFARWTPAGILVGALLFGFTSALQFQFQAAALGVPYQFFLMLPYVVTLVALVLSRSRESAPRALGTAYDPS